MEFEKKLSGLEDIVKKLREESLSLEDGIRLFEKGLVLTRECLQSLNESKGKIEVIKTEMEKLVDGQ